MTGLTTFADRAWRHTERLREAIHALPFNRELAAGTLSRERFQGYIIQDALYLAQYGRALALAAAKAESGGAFRTFAAGALEAVAVEQALHETYLASFGLGAQVTAGREPSPDCLGYTSYLIATAYHEPWEILAAALLPCFWLYWDVGNAITRTAAPDNPYRAWIDTYSDEAFGAAVQAVIAITNEAAEATTDAIRNRMLTAFARSSQWEWLFWDSAYQQRGWPVAL